MDRMRTGRQSLELQLGKGSWMSKRISLDRSIGEMEPQRHAKELLSEWDPERHRKGDQRCMWAFAYEAEHWQTSHSMLWPLVS